MAASGGIAMDPIIRSAAVTAGRRTLGRPGLAPATPAPAPDAAPLPVAAPADVPAFGHAPSAPLPTAADMAAESAATLERVRAMLADAEAGRLAWESHEREARASLARGEEELARREEALAAAQHKHEQSVQGAHADAALRGHEEGLARGIAEGRAGADAACAQRLAQLDALAVAMEAARADALAGNEDMLVEVAWTAICRLAGEQALSRDGALAMVRTAAAQVRNAHGLRVRVHPQDAEWLQGKEVAGRWALEADQAVALGGCIVDCAHGALDARLELQLERLRAALLTARMARPVGGGEQT